MKKAPLPRLLVLAAAAGALTGAFVPDSGVEAASPRDTRKVTIICKPGWRGGAVGRYGDQDFAVSCENGRAVQHLRGVTSTAYSARMGVESDELAADCFFTGDEQAVAESCVQVRLHIN